MNSPQLRLFPVARPLTERLGSEIFRAIPDQPGVYSMFDARERMIYVGQSKDLRKRVGSYRYINPERSSRRLVRLVHAVERISWEVCETAEAARLRENHLLRTHRPKFNSLNTYPKAHVFIGLKCAPDFFGYCYTRELVEREETLFFGAFKSGALGGFQSLLRLVWASLHQPESPYDFPRALLKPVPAKEFSFATIPEATRSDWKTMSERLNLFLDGNETDLLKLLREKLANVQAQSVFMQNLLQSDFDNAGAFYERAALRNFQLRTEFAIQERLIQQEQLDDLLARKAGGRTGE